MQQAKKIGGDNQVEHKAKIKMKYTPKPARQNKIAAACKA